MYTVKVDRCGMKILDDGDVIGIIQPIPRPPVLTPGISEEPRRLAKLTNDHDAQSA